jgi:adenylate kinase family enzyme
MHRVVIFGNSGSGKSTLAKEKAEFHSCAHLDLDTVAWDDGYEAPTRRPLMESAAQIESFLTKNENWVIEGCYSDLLNLVIAYSTELIFLNPGVKTCIANCKNRPWEPHKYDSLQAQNANLEMLSKWIENYSMRQDEFSLTAHRQLYDSYTGKKHEYTSNSRHD